MVVSVYKTSLTKSEIEGSETKILQITAMLFNLFFSVYFGDLSLAKAISVLK